MSVWDFDAGECDWLLVLAESRLQWVTSTPTLITITPHFSIIPPLSKSVNDTLALVPIQLIKLYVHRVLDVSPAMRGASARSTSVLRSADVLSYPVLAEQCPSSMHDMNHRPYLSIE